MSSKLKKKNKNMGITNKMIKDRKVSKSYLNQNRMIEDSFKRLALIGCYVIHDEFGFAQKRITKYIGTMQEVLDKWYNDNKLSGALMRYAESKKFDYKAWVSKVPMSNKLRIANAKTNYTNALDTGRTLDSAFMLFGLLSIVVLKEEFRLSNKQLEQFFDSMIYCIDSYCKKDYGNETYLSDKRVQETLLEECKFDIFGLLLVS